MRRGPEEYLRKNAGVLRKNKREVRIADYVASQVVPMLSRMFERQHVAYRYGIPKRQQWHLFQ
mgnify:CR=1 FL=1